ncbi:P-loop containing nucleoside triphosphate hydrolase protein [Guyanagaster necrorhizus]|uniref:RNA helicase n=1 Tax=Guyanagaster necrorhizus TaxID=856835 RepID=A0A9P8AYH7_9AGAR|nr:P-loop containing nucleoside triphosphate hydrolase protein [Guyanagaster necrorhizus MCA 3950]KAG7452226.1 P-loop containing nucleoside triphosphate hydrolase protein [Guyanagaster necrorhizus MCA 3950]
MAPRKGIVKSGNAGNSSKPSDKPSDSTDREKSLFPPGSKYPLSLLHERCQKNGWEKPIVETRQTGADWAFTVILNRINKKSSEKESVRLTPHPPYVMPSALEARHWGATYALYRFCNDIQLNRVLPVGPRSYWTQLAAEHKNAPEHLKWMYDADPFTARKMVDWRQAKAAEKRAEPEAKSDSHKSEASSGFQNWPEVKMSNELRDQVEDAVKQGWASLPKSAHAAVPKDIPEEEMKTTSQKLQHLGFTPIQAGKAVDFVSEPSAISTTLLASQGFLEACIEYLVLHVPECDLPERFLPEVNSSNSFITSVHVGTDDLKTRWVADKATKEAGWPVHVVQECLSDSRLMNSWDLLVAALGQRLIGEDITSLFDENKALLPYEIDLQDVEDLGGHVDDHQLVLPLFTAPIQLHILYSAKEFPRQDYMPMYLTSSKVPAYVRLHMLSLLLCSGELVDAGGGFCVTALAILDEEWAKIETNGPPSISTVFQHFSRRSEVASHLELEDVPIGQVTGRRRGNHNSQDRRTAQKIKEEYEGLRKTKKAQYEDIMAIRQKLPAFASKHDFLKELEDNRVVLVVGETGCGKTTQLPQFVLDSLIDSNRGKTASIVITQPRRISAIGVASRVSNERLDDGSVGYAIRGESTRTQETKLLFCTTGVVLRRLSSGDKLKDVSHIIVDEVHERSVDGDFLLLELKELLTENKTLKVVLMSATINHETFISYFDGAPLITIPGFTHPVTDLYLEDVISLIDYRPSAVKPAQKECREEREAFRAGYVSIGLSDECITALQNVTRANVIDYKMLAAVVKHIVTISKTRGGILIFLPGVQEIRQCMDMVKGVLPSSVPADILPLHANLSSEEQRRVFMKTTKWKIIAATNVAETSITIDDVICVVDSGKVKQTQYDGDSGISHLVETWVTLAEARQRRGRAGRTQPGTCYKLYTRKQESKMGKFVVPEILRVPLENILLAVKVTREDEDVRHFLRKAISPPDVSSMDTAWATLENLGAMDGQGRLTALGRHLSLLPVDLRLAKMLVLGTIFRCLGPVLTIVACLSSKPLFVSPLEKRKEASRARARFCEGNSDLLTDLRAYDECMRLQAEGRSSGEIRRFCEANFLLASTIREISNLRNDFLSCLISIGFIPLHSKSSSSSININSENTNLLKAVILGGLWPRVAHVDLPLSARKYDRVQGGTVQRENKAKEFKIYDLRNERVFLHPASVLFDFSAWRSQYVVFFTKVKTSKVFLRDATEVPLYAMLLFGGTVSVNQIAGGISIDGNEGVVKLKGWPRIGILVNHLRRLLDAQLLCSIEESMIVGQGPNNPVIEAMLALLAHDGLSE